MNSARRGIGRIAARLPPLLLDRPFRRYWSGQTISMFGDQISSIVLPLAAVITLHASPAQMGILTALFWLPSLLFALTAGAWVDKRGRRRATMIVADLGRAALLATIPVCYALGVLTIWPMYAVAFGTGLFSVFFTVCQPAVFVALVPREQYVDGQSLVYGSRALSYVGGPSVGGLLVQALTAPFAVVADALSFLCSAYFLNRIRPAEAPPAGTGRGTVMAGAKFIRHSPIVRASLTAITVVNFFMFVYSALITLYVIRTLHVRPGVYGVILGCGAFGGLIAAVVTKRAAARLGAGLVYTLGCLIFTAPLALVPLAGGSQPVIAAMLFAASFLSAFGVMALDITIGAIFAVVIPNELRSRVSGAFQTANYGTRPLGALTGGLLGTVVGLRSGLWIAVIGGTTGFLLLLPTAMPRFRMPPEVGQSKVTVPSAAGADDASPRARVGGGAPSQAEEARARKS
jgi:MFS family permease